MTAKMRVGLIGSGAIGGVLLGMLAEAGVEVAAVLTRSPRLDLPPNISVTALEALLAADADVIIECAGQEAFRQHVPSLLREGRDVIAISGGALAEERVEEEVREAARLGGAGLSIASGAVIGLDGLAAARPLGIHAVTYRQRAPVDSWIGHPLAPPDLAARPEHLLFEGTARHASRLFPKNANVTASVALAGIGFDRTTVQLVSDASISRNTHVLEADGEFGTLRAEVSAKPVAPGVKSSRLVAGSLVHAVLRRIARIGL